jgi:hypothetical protein
VVVQSLSLSSTHLNQYIELERKEFVFTFQSVFRSSKLKEEEEEEEEE